VSSFAFDADIAFVAGPAVRTRLALLMALRAIVISFIGVRRIVVLAIVIPMAPVIPLYATVGNHAEIVIGELQVIFRLHPVAVHLRIMRELLVLLEHLRRIAARPAVNPVGLATLLTVAAASAAAIIATILLVQGISLPYLLPA
jgi:hypothetical protein